MNDNLADRKQVRDAKRREEERRLRAVNDWKWVMSEPAGRRAVAGLLEAAGFEPYQEPQHARGDEQQRLIGMQRLAHMIKNTILSACGMDAFLLMLRECELQRKKDERTADAVKTTSSTEAVDALS